jgi:hypothetical protein
MVASLLMVFARGVEAAVRDQMTSGLTEDVK